MKNVELERFITDFQKDPALSKEFTHLGDDPEAWVRLATAKGYRLTVDEASGLSSSYAELSDEDLENVAGGWDGDGSGDGGG